MEGHQRIEGAGKPTKRLFVRHWGSNSRLPETLSFSIPIPTPTIVHLPGGGKPPDVVGWRITRCWCRPRRRITRQDDKLFDKNRECFCASVAQVVIHRASITEVTVIRSITKKTASLEYHWRGNDPMIR